MSKRILFVCSPTPQSLPAGYRFSEDELTVERHLSDHEKAVEILEQARSIGLNVLIWEVCSELSGPNPHS